MFRGMFLLLAKDDRNKLIGIPLSIIPVWVGSNTVPELWLISRTAVANGVTCLEFLLYMFLTSCGRNTNARYRLGSINLKREI